MSPTKIRRALAQMLYHFGDITNSFPSELNVKIGSHLVLELSQELDSFKLIKVVLEKMDAKTRSIVMLRLFNQFTPTQNDIDLQTRMEFEQTQKELDTLEKIGIRQFMNHLPLKELSAVTPSVAKRLHQTLSDELHLAKEANPMLFFNYKTRRAIVSELGQCAMIDTDKPVALRFREALARAI